MPKGTPKPGGATHCTFCDLVRGAGEVSACYEDAVAAAVKRVTQCDAMNIIVNSGAAAGQDELHYHVHIIPRRKGDGFDVPLPFDGSEMPDRTLLDATAARIGAALRDPLRHERTAHTRAGDAEREPRASGGRPTSRPTSRTTRR